MVQEPITNGGVQGRLDGMPFIKRSCSPSVKSEANSTLSSSPSPRAFASNERVQATPVHQFNTAIDNVMRVIEAKREILGPSDEVELVQADEKKEVAKDNQVCRARILQPWQLALTVSLKTQRGRGKAKRKRFCCEIPGCSKMFAQKNNLDTHRRSHTGESPYVSISSLLDQNPSPNHD
jgi:hypothetical protein